MTKKLTLILLCIYFLCLTDVNKCRCAKMSLKSQKRVSQLARRILCVRYGKLNKLGKTSLHGAGMGVSVFILGSHHFGPCSCSSSNKLPVYLLISLPVQSPVSKHICLSLLPAHIVHIMDTHFAALILSLIFVDSLLVLMSAVFYYALAIFC